MKTYSEFITERLVTEKRDENAIMLIDAAKKGKVAAIKTLLGRGVDVDVKNEYGNNALTFATYFKKFNAIKALVEAGANVNIELGEGMSVLSIALEGGDERIINFLKDNGAVESEIESDEEEEYSQHDLDVKSREEGLEAAENIDSVPEPDEEG